VVEVFTTRPDTIMGVTYVVLAPENPLVKKVTSSENKEAVDQYIKDVVGKSDMERTSTGVDRGKTGVPLGAFAVHPITGERVPIWAADYVLANYGTGAVMAVPAHDERDLAFAEKFSLGIKTVVRPSGKELSAEESSVLFTGTGVTCNSGEFDGLSTDDCKAAVIKKLVSLDAGGEQVTYKLRDWVFSRQRYWGEPIPIYFPVEMLTEDGSGSPIEGAAHRILHDQPIPVDDSELPLKLPEMTNFQPGDDPR
jgi:leucyl-tRNA synthetase